MFSVRISYCTTKGYIRYIRPYRWPVHWHGLLSIYFGWVLQSSLSSIIRQIQDTGLQIGSIKFGAFSQRKTAGLKVSSILETQNLLTSILAKTSGVWLIQNGVERTRTKETKDTRSKEKSLEITWHRRSYRNYSALHLFWLYVLHMYSLPLLQMRLQWASFVFLNFQSTIWTTFVTSQTKKKCAN